MKDFEWFGPVDGEMKRKSTRDKKKQRRGRKFVGLFSVEFSLRESIVCSRDFLQAHYLSIENSSSPDQMDILQTQQQ